MKLWKIKARLNGFRPLAIDEFHIYGYMKGYLIRSDYQLQSIEPLGRLPVKSIWLRWFQYIRLLDRVLRLSPNVGYIHAGNFFVVWRSEIYRYEFDSGLIFKDFTIPNNRKALTLNEIKVGCSEANLVFGEYFENELRASVRIWARNQEFGTWFVLGLIPEGEIEHIHSIYQFEDLFLIFTGDFDSAAGIWSADMNFSTIKPLLRDSQQYRGAWAASINGRIFYATDTPMEVNSIYEILGLKDGSVRAHKCTTISGSSIYSAPSEDCHYFSTTVEGDVPTGYRIFDIFSTYTGAGILSKNAHIMLMRAGGKVENIFLARKDFLPYRLAQFGTFTFPTGRQLDDVVIAYGIGLCGFDDVCLILAKN